MAAPDQPNVKQETTTRFRDRDNNSMESNARTFSFGDHDDHEHDESRLISGRGSRTALTQTTTTHETAPTTTAAIGRYDVEHLATFSAATSDDEQQQVGAASSSSSATTDKRDNGPRLGGLKQRQTTSGHGTSAGGRRVIDEPREALKQLFELEKLSGIWTQRMQIGFDQEFMLIVDCETDSVVERFHRQQVSRPEAFNHYSDIYSNIIVFHIDQQQQQRERQRPSDAHKTESADNTGRACDQTPGELHIFQCISHKAKQLVADILAWKSDELPSASAGGGRLTGRVALVNKLINDGSSDNIKPLGASESAGGDNLEPRLAPKRAEMSPVGNKNKSPSSSPGDRAAQGPGGKEAAQGSEYAATTTDNNNGGSLSSKPAVTVASGGSKCHESPAVVPNVNVRETVQVFNQIAALREKSAGSNQVARPLSDASGSSGSHQSNPAQQAQSSGTGSSAFSRAHLNSAGQSYKQRSIRATLAPKNQTQIDGDTQNQSQGSASSASSSSSSSSSLTATAANHNTSNSSPAQPEHKSTETSGATAKTGYRDGRPLAQRQQQKLATGVGAIDKHNTNHTQASPVDRHNYDHNNQHQHNHRQASALVDGGGGKSSAPASANNPKKSSNRSRLPTTDGHNHHHRNHHHQDVSAGANSSSSSSSSSNSNSSSRSQGLSQAQQQQQLQPMPPPPPPADEQVTSNESYVSVLNHCFDDIEKFILRIQHAYAAARELQAKRRHTKRSLAPHHPVGHHQAQHSNGPLPPLPPSMSATELARLVAQAQGPSPDDYFEILSKFKLAFNLLAKLKGCIHEPNAPELIHFLFTPLAIIIESARNLAPPIDPTAVGIPYLNKDALDLLSNCCTSRESDLWYSLGPNWTETIDAQLLSASRLPNSFQPIFSDGWAPVISELELIGLVAPRPPASPVALDSHHNYQRAGAKPNQLPKNATREHTLLASNGDSHPAPSVNSKPPKHKGMPQRAREGIDSSGYMHAEYLGDPMIDSARPSLEDQPRTFPGPEAPSISHKQRPARHSMPNEAKIGRALAKQSTQVAAHRRNSDFVGHQYGQPPPPSMLLANNSFIGPKDDDLNGRYAAGYSTALSNDYTELHIDDAGHRASHQYRMAGYLARHGEQHALNDRHSRQKGSRSSAYSSGQYQHNLASERHIERGLDLVGHNMEREAMLADIGPAQTEWFYELKLRGALIVRVLFSREANNDKELTVKRGEILEILDDTRKWWKARNIDLQVAHVPHTIVAIMEHYQTLDELLTGGAGDMIMMVNEDQAAHIDSQRYADYREQANLTDGVLHGQYYGLRDEKRNSKNAKGAFRYF